MTYFLLQNTQKSILKCIGDQGVWLPVDFCCMEKKKKSNFSKCYADESKSNMFGTTWGSVNNDRIVIFEWNTRLIFRSTIQKICVACCYSWKISVQESFFHPFFFLRFLYPLNIVIYIHTLKHSLTLKGWGHPVLWWFKEEQGHILNSFSLKASLFLLSSGFLCLRGQLSVSGRIRRCLRSCTSPSSL